MQQMLDRQSLLMQACKMKVPDEKKVRDILRVFLARKGHGAVSAFADKCGVNRMTLTRFRDGGAVEGGTLIRIVDALEKEGVWKPSETQDIPSELPPTEQEEWSFNQSLLRALMRNEPQAQLALNLRGLAARLLDDSFSALKDEDEILKLLEYIAHALRAYLASAKEREDSGS